MRFIFGGLAVLANLLDNLTTWLCLHAPFVDFALFEANPFARVLFDTIGLAEGLLLETVITTAAIGFLVFSKQIPPAPKLALLGVLLLLPAWAAANNLEVMHEVGIALRLL